MEKSELIKKFLANKCSAEEGERVLKILEAEPYLLDELLRQEEWEADTPDEVREDVHLKDAIWQRVASNTRGLLVSSRFLRPVAVAAGVLLIIVLGFYFNRSEKATHSGKTAIASLSDSIHIEENHSGHIRELSLEDGSVITLYPGSSVRYALNFKENRSIRLLTGKAAFDVAKDPRHPFTVFSGNIATTALGTRFIVDQAGGRVNVRLYEGKVVVKHTDTQVKLQPTYLTPGEQCIVNAARNGVIIASLNNEQFSDVVKELRGAGDKATPVAAGNKLKFYNVPLNEAFDLLEQLYNKRIIYTGTGVERMYFTGNFAAHDSLIRILSILTSVNGLMVKNEDGSIAIVRSSGSTIAGPQSKNDDPEHAVKTGGSGAMPLKSRPGRQVLAYENAALEQVFSDMEQTFGITIRYDRSDVNNKYFTGSITSQDNVGAVLSIICRMNQLQVTGKGQEYRVVR